MRLLLSFFFILVSPVWALQNQPLTITWANASTAQPLEAHLISSDPTTWQIEGLPFPGVVLWRPQTQELAYQHPTELSWLRLTPADLPKTTPPTLTRAEAGKPWQTQPTQRWAVNNGKISCGALLTIPAQLQLNVSGLQNIHALLHWLNIGETPTGCLAPYPNHATLGLPTHWGGPMGTLTLQNIGPLSADFVATPWPTTTYPITAEARLRMLLSQLPVPDRARFIQTHAQLPLLIQIEKLSTLLKSRYGNPAL